MNIAKFIRTAFFIEHLWWLLLKQLELQFENPMFLAQITLDRTQRQKVSN